MLLSTFRSRVSGAIGLSNVASSAEQVLVDGWANEAVVQFLRLTKCYVQPFTMALTAAVGDYDLPTSALAIKSLWLDSASSQDGTLERTSSGEIDIRRRYLAPAGTNPYLYALEGANLLRIYPNAVSSSDILNGLYVPRPTAMSSGAHDSSSATYGGIPSEFDPTLEAYTAWRAAEYDDDTSSKIGLQYKQEWLEGVRNANASLNRKAGVSLGRALVRGRRRLPQGNGVDWR